MLASPKKKLARLKVMKNVWNDLKYKLMRESYEVEYALYIYVSMDEYTNYSREKTHFLV
jgi:hypothetical protein